MSRVTIIAVGILVAGISFTAGCTTALFRQQIKQEVQDQKDIAEIKEEIESIYEVVALNNETQGNILSHHGRLLHYISGHQSNNFVKFCPECGLLEQLAIRRLNIDKRVVEISEFLIKNPDDPTAADKKKELEELNNEDKLATQKIYSADERAKELSKLIKVRE